MVGEKSYGEPMKDLSGYFKDGERERIYNACDSVRDKVLIRVLWKSGRRIGEVLMLKVSDIDFEQRDIVWNIEKKKKPTRKRKPIDEFTLKLLKYFITNDNLKQTDFVFKSPFSNLAITRQRAFQIVTRACEKAGIELVGEKRPHPHHFRHSFAIDMAKKLDSAADLRKLQMLLEHSNLGVTETYLQFGSEDLRSLIED